MPEGKMYQPPTGGRDLLPLDVAQKRWIEDRLEQVFHQWGYHRIITYRRDDGYPNGRRRD